LHLQHIQRGGLLRGVQPPIQGEILGGLSGDCLAQSDGILIPKDRVVILSDLVNGALERGIICDLGDPVGSLCLLNGSLCWAERPTLVAGPVRETPPLMFSPVNPLPLAAAAAMELGGDTVLVPLMVPWWE
jgi:hypothetical protein